MEKELILFIAVSAALIFGTAIYSVADKNVVEEQRKHKLLLNWVIDKIAPANRPYDLLKASGYAWKTWGNIGAIYDITVTVIVVVIATGWWWALLWLPIYMWLWWLFHDLFTGWFILGKPLHISSDPISQYFGRAFQQSGLLLLGWKLLWLFMLTMGYLGLSFNITLW